MSLFILYSLQIFHSISPRLRWNIYNQKNNLNLRNEIENVQYSIALAISCVVNGYSNKKVY